MMAQISPSAQAQDPLVLISSFVKGEEGSIQAFRFDLEKGALELVHKNPSISNPFFLAASPDGKVLYSIDTPNFGDKENDLVAAFVLEKSSGKLTRLNATSSRGTAACYLSVDPSGKTVLVANYSSGSVAALPVKADGSLGDAASFDQHSGSSVDPKRQKGPNAHCIEISPDGRFALSADLGIDKVMIYQLDAAKARLTLNEAQPFVKIAPGSGPRHLTFHPDGKSVYLINELSNTITVFAYAADSGKLTERQTISTLPEGFKGTSYCADLKITPDGRFLYGTNRGHDSVAMYEIGEKGQLTLLGIEPSLGKGPQNLLITPDGAWLICANMPGNNVIVFQINKESGKLAVNGEAIDIPMPSCIRWVK
ncbi:MAG: lactonase family protein [Verrucomicrobiota bacterium]